MPGCTEKPQSQASGRAGSQAHTSARGMRNASRERASGGKDAASALALPAGTGSRALASAALRCSVLLYLSCAASVCTGSQLPAGHRAHTSRRSAPQHRAAAPEPCFAGVLLRLAAHPQSIFASPPLHLLLVFTLRALRCPSRAGVHAQRRRPNSGAAGGWQRRRPRCARRLRLSGSRAISPPGLPSTTHTRLLDLPRRPHRLCRIVDSLEGCRPEGDEGTARGPALARS